MKVYYAHCMALYGTKQEIRDVEILESLGFDVVNPNSDAINAEVDEIPDHADKMAYFERFAESCDAIAFRALPGGAIPGGVAKEIGWFNKREKPVIELPNFSLRPQLDKEETRLYLRETGSR